MPAALTLSSTLLGEHVQQEQRKPITYKYGRYYICRRGKFYVVKAQPTDSQPIHPGCFKTPSDAEEFIDNPTR